MINQHTVYQHIEDIPDGIEVKGPVFHSRQQVKYIESNEHQGKTGWVNNILFAPNVDHYYQRIRVNTGSYNFIESASRMWESC